jgi:heterotetrameric sarcosine oxidase gamma subunit
MVEQHRNVRGTPPVAPNTFTDEAIWLGPDEWLALGDAPLDDDARVVDVSDQRTALDLTGADARERVARGCTLDLHPDAFPPGACAQTLVAQVPALILSRPGGLRLLVGSSYAEHLREWL